MRQQIMSSGDRVGIGRRTKMIESIRICAGGLYSVLTTAAFFVLPSSLRIHTFYSNM